MAQYSLTVGNDTIVTASSGSTVFATAATLNVGDSLTGGVGTDVLQLVGSGAFRVDQLTNFTGFESIEITNATNAYADLTLGSQPIRVDSDGLLEIYVRSPSNWNGSNVINGSADLSRPTYLYFFNSTGIPSSSQAYDLTSTTLSHVGITAASNDLSFTISNSVAASARFFNAAGSNDLLTTAGSTLDLSHTTVSGFRVTSSNALGTTFTVADLGTALQIAGGPGHDTLDAHSLALTADQRTALFGTGSIETIIDQTGTYDRPSGLVGLTSGNDTIVTASSGSTVFATAATLNAGDSLTGGAGTDVLQLVGSGAFRVDQLTNFTGFESIELTNATNAYADLTLGSQPIRVDSDGLLEMYVRSPSNWNGGNVINGSADPSRPTYLYFFNSSSPSGPQTYDLTSNALSHVSIAAAGSDLSFVIDSSVAAGVRSFIASGSNDQLITSGSTLDLSHSLVSGFRVASSNGLGTTFTVADLGTALQIAGGAGHDTLDAHSLALTSDQRTAIFGTGSIETIIDQTGTYDRPSGLVGLTSGNDTIVTASSGSTVFATAATLNAGDSLTGGAGTDVLQLVGSGAFRVDQLTNFTGFESIELTNATNAYADLTLGSQPIRVDSDGLLEMYVRSPSNWNGGNVINGSADPSRPTYLYFFNSSSPSGPQTYDLTSNALSHVSIAAAGNDLSFVIDSSVAAGVRSFIASGSNDQLITSGSTLDLSHSLVSGFRVASSNGLGTTFTVADLGTALQIAGGAGHDTLDAHSLALTADQRTAIFGTGSIETIIDQTGTYNTDHPALHNVSSDFDGNGKSDILWLNSDGKASIWDNGDIQGAHWIAPAGTISNGWRFAGTGDFDANGKDDILWVNDDGKASIWDNGQISSAHIIAPAGTISNGWHLAGTGDFDANGKVDIAWVNDNGKVSVWDNGEIGGAHIVADLGNTINGWHFAGTGDFDANGKSDFLWVNDNGQASIWDSGQVANAHIIAPVGTIPQGWHFAGTGDFDGNGGSDILWVNSDGKVSIWDNGQIGGAHIIAPVGTISNGWHFARVGDFDGNGHDDILWHNDNGAVSIWTDGQIAGAHITVAANTITPDWHIA